MSLPGARIVACVKPSCTFVRPRVFTFSQGLAARWLGATNCKHRSDPLSGFSSHHVSVIVRLTARTRTSLVQTASARRLTSTFEPVRHGENCPDQKSRFNAERARDCQKSQDRPPSEVKKAVP